MMPANRLAKLPSDLSLIAPLAATLAVFAAITYGTGLSLPFIGDDYVFLDKTRTASFSDLWSLENTDFGWYRPWSREVHFWLLQRVAGVQEAAFRVAGVVLWIVALCLFATAVRRVATPRVAGIATLGVASLALWATPLLWISGSQDLWMLVFAMASLNLFMAGRIWWAAVPFALGLLSKETGAVVPALLCAFLIIVEHRTIGAALRRTAHLWLILLAWVLIHPTIVHRLTDPELQQTPEVATRPSLLLITAKTLLSVLNLDVFPEPVEVSAPDVLRLLAMIAVVVSGAVVLRRIASSVENPESFNRRPFVAFAVSWMAIGWLPLFLPSISWHAYYGCLGALGGWLAVALWLDRRPLIVGPLLGCLVILQWAHAHTMSWDWGNEWYQRRAGRMLSSIRDNLLHQYPTLPHHSRVYFGHIPNNIGLVAGQSPALRVWYGDETLQAGFYSWYRPRHPAEAPGPDFFFRFDSLAGMVEISAGSENIALATASNPQWEADHEKLAMLFLRSGDVGRAGTEFAKLSQLPHRADAAVFAGVCLGVVGDSAAADSLIQAAQTRTQVPWAEMQSWVDRLKATMPQPGPRNPPGY